MHCHQPDTSDQDGSWFERTRYKRPTAIDEELLRYYWDYPLPYPLPVYNSSCRAAIDEADLDQQYPYCYSTRWPLVARNRTRWAAYYEAVYLLRKSELDYAVAEMAEQHPYMLEAKVFLVGASEGGMTAARYHHPLLDQVLSARLISAWSCEMNYYVSCVDSARICGDECRKDVPTVNVISSVVSCLPLCSSWC